jgi:ADP-ribose pyrophosphatase
MAEDRTLADRAADVAVGAFETLAAGFLPYRRYQVTLRGADGASVTQQRDIIRAGKVVAVLPVDLARAEIVLIRQFRLAAHLANGQGDLVEIVAGRVEADEDPPGAAARECVEEIGVAPKALVELFSYLTTPGITDEEVTVFLAAVDANKVPARPLALDGEHIETMRVPIDAATAAVAEGRMRNGPLVIALQWLALNRSRLPDLLRG